MAIIRYLARKHDLIGKNEEEKLRVGLLEQQLKDYNNAFVRIAYDPNFDTLKEDYIKNLAQALESLSKFLGGRPFFAGNKLLIFSFV